jgi:hypothetical protein
MRHEFAGVNGTTDNVGDVLASIRRLIAQDQATRPEGAAPLDDSALTASLARPTPLHVWSANPPLILARQDLIPVPPAAELAESADIHCASIDGVEPALTAEEEAEFAEAEAALARMTAPSRAAEPEPQVNAPEPQAQVAHLPVVNLFCEPSDALAEPSLRDLIRDAIQQELQGEVGLRVSRHLQQMVRAEVEAVIREICAEG